ncbi:DUF3304 domain-containing protein [Enterobacteriaceae bacterium LUAb1]
MQNIRWGMRGSAVVISGLLAGCSPSQAGGRDTTAVTVGAYNHVAGQRINWFSVNGYWVPGLGGGYCCVTLPDQWQSGMTAHIEWEVDPNPNENIPRLKKGVGFEPKALAEHEAKYKHYSADVPIPQYNHLGEFSVHILPCQKVNIYTGVEGPNSPAYPIKEPMNMQEPAICPK